MQRQQELARYFGQWSPSGLAWRLAFRVVPGRSIIIFAST